MALSVKRFCTFSCAVLEIIHCGRWVVSKRIFDWFLKRCVYQQFVAGENLTEIQQCVTKLQLAGIRSMLAVPLEEDIGERNNVTDIIYDRNLNVCLECIKSARALQPHQPKIQIRLTALMRPSSLTEWSLMLCNSKHNDDLIEKLANGMRNNEWVVQHGFVHEKELNDVLKRLRLIGEAAQDNGVSVLVDAEYTYMNKAIQSFILAMMLVFNRHQAVICSTYQCYLKETYNTLLKDVEFVVNRHGHFGLKLVRGAYMYREREVAALQKCADPVHDCIQDTSNMYTQCVNSLLDYVASNRCALMIATHNEHSITHALNRANSLDIDPKKELLSFAQLLGMCDHVSYTLGQSIYPVYKSVPYGELDDTLPYLIRRAHENRTVLPGTRQEKKLLFKALLFRCMHIFQFRNKT